MREIVFCRASSCDHVQKCDCFGEGLSSWSFHAVLAGLGDAHQRRGVGGIAVSGLWVKQMNT